MKRAICILLTLCIIFISGCAQNANESSKSNISTEVLEETSANSSVESTTSDNSTTSEDITTSKDSTSSKDTTTSKDSTSSKDTTTSKDSTTSKDTTTSKDSTTSKEPGTKPENKQVHDIAKIYIEIDTDIIREDYRDCSLTIVDVDDNKITDSESKIKIRGNSTASGAKKPYNFKLSEKRDVLGLGVGKKWCLLANCYEKTLIRNKMVLDFAREATKLSYTPDSMFVDVYLNGKLSGNYILCEAVEVGSSRVDIDTDKNEFLLERDIRIEEEVVYVVSPIYQIRFAINEPEEPTQEQLDWIMNFLEEAETALGTWDGGAISKYFDIESMVDFYIVLEYFKQVDVNVSSTRFYIKDGKIHGGPVWDYDLTMGNCSDKYYSEYNNSNGSGKSSEGFYCNVDWYNPLQQCEEFKQLRNQRYLELQDSITALYSGGNSYIKTITEKYKASFARNYKEAGWDIAHAYSEYERKPEKTYEKNVEYLATWLKERNEWLLKAWNLK